MKKALLLAILAALAACGNVASPGGDAGTTDTGTGGTGGTPSCFTCGAVVNAGQPVSSLCSTSASLFEALQAYACDPGRCGAECALSLCSGVAADLDCKPCLQTKCAASLASCANDKSTH